MFTRKESASPEPRAERLRVSKSLRNHDDKGWQILGLGAESVTHPGPEARSAWLFLSSLEERNARLMVDGLGVH